MPSPPDGVFEFRFCTVEADSERQLVTTRFPDGTEAHACPHHTPEYVAHAVDKGCGEDVWLYCIEHDLTHILIGEAQGGPSKVLWALAHDETTEGAGFDLEEQAAQHLHRFLNHSGWPLLASTRA